MMSSNRYQRVGDDDLIENVTELTEIAPTAPIAEGELAIANPIHPEGHGSLSVKILLKEKSFELSGLSESTTISELKSAVETTTTIPVTQQRLICAGKQLKPDTKKLSDFKISSGCSIHLFPLPVTVSSVPVANAVTEGSHTGAVNPLTAQAVSASSTNESEIAHRPIHFDPYISQTSREVKLWCLILMFLSGMTLFNNLSYVTASGRLGQGILDSIVTVIDTACSALGLVVANMGIQSVRTMELDDVNKYVRALVGLASVAVILRILWVIDVILQVQKVVKDSQEGEDGDGKGKDDPSVGMDDPTATGQPMDDRTVVSFGIQACIIALICIFAWGSCVMRARRLQDAVANYSNAMQV